jgi:hypothetical protein
MKGTPKYLLASCLLNMLVVITFVALAPATAFADAQPGNEREATARVDPNYQPNNQSNDQSSDQSSPPMIINNDKETNEPTPEPTYLDQNTGQPVVSYSKPTEPTTTWELGPAFPSAGDVTNSYGSVWLRGGLTTVLARDEHSVQSAELSVYYGQKSSDISYWMTDLNQYDTGTATNEALIIGLGYAYKMKTASPFYLGAGVDVDYITTSATYQTQPGDIWNSTNSDTIALSKSAFAFAPRVFMGYQVSNKVGIELGYTMLNTTLAGNDAGFANLPSVPDANLPGIFDLSANVAF